MRVKPSIASTRGRRLADAEPGDHHVGVGPAWCAQFGRAADRQGFFQLLRKGINELLHAYRMDFGVKIGALERIANGMGCVTAGSRAAPAAVPGGVQHAPEGPGP